MATTRDPADTPREQASGQDALWRVTGPDRRHPAAAGPIETDVVVVGGGIVGMTTAALAADTGLGVVVLEARRLGSGTTGGTTGKLTSQNDTRLATLTDRFGRDGARHYAALCQRGIAVFDELTERHAIACDRESARAHLVALDQDHADQVGAEAAAARDCGLPVAVDLDLPEVDLPAAAVLTVLDQRQLHAVKYVHGLADAVLALGGRVFEDSRVVDVEADRGGDRRWRVTTEQAEIRTDHVVLATRLPTHRDARILFGRTKPVSSVGVAARVDGPAPRDMYLFKGERTWSIRGTRDDQAGEHLVAVGMGEPTGAWSALGQRTDAVAAWAGEHWPVTAVEHRWMAQDQDPADGRPFVGGLWGDGIWTATGFGKWGLAAGTAAAELLVHHVTGRSDPYDGFFGASRLEPPSGWRQILRANLRVGALFVGDRLTSLPRGVEDLAPGDGRVVRRGRTPIAVSRDLDGRITAVSATCTHLGCLVRWNREEATWDCGCHGSRFAPDGTVLEAPATSPLRPIAADD